MNRVRWGAPCAIGVMAVACSSSSGHVATSAEAGEILVSVSGESLALTGYPFPPASTNDVAFVDGWTMRFTRVLVTVDNVTLSDNPDYVPTDQSQTGAPVATLRGPWAIDLHKGGPLAGKGGAGEQAVPIAVFKSQDNGSAFDTTKRYAFGFNVVAANPAAINVNLDADASSDYNAMIAEHASTLIVGTATFMGAGMCTSPDASYPFNALPTTVNFRFSLATPTTYVNCQNPEAQGAPFEGEEHPRGVQILQNSGATVAQITLHTDHLFWESFTHDSPLHFDPFAARAVPADGGAATLTLDNLAGSDFTAFKDARGAYLPWRSCLPTYTARKGPVVFDALSVPVNPSAPADRAIRDFRDYVAYSQSTFGHLNADGLCFVRRNYASPP